MPYEDRLQLASIYIQSDAAERAVPLLNEAISQNPERPEAYDMLGEILFLQGDLDGSLRHWTKAIEVGGDDPLILNNLAWVSLKQGHTDEAFDLIERALGLDPVPVYPYLDTRSRILLALGRRAEALGDARTALGQVPEHDTRMKEQLEELVKDIEKNIHGPDENGY